MKEVHLLKNKKTIDEITSILNKNRLQFNLIGNKKGAVLNSVAPTISANPQSISFIGKNRKDKKELFKNCSAGLLICDKEVLGLLSKSKNLIICDDPQYYFSIICNEIIKTKQNLEIDKCSSIAESAKIGKNVSVGAYSVIEDGVVVGNNSIIGSNVRICSCVKIGRGVIIQSGCKIGSSGFGYQRFGKRLPINFPHLGSVEVGDFVEIGSNTCVDRGCFGATTIGRGSKIDNLVHIGHNVVIGKNVYVAALTSIAGSTTIEDYATIWTGVNIAERKIIGKLSQVGIGSVVISNVEKKKKVFGNPGRVYGNSID